MRDGFEGASVDDIARAARVSKATLYSYFPDKRLLFTEVARIECNRQAEAAFGNVDEGNALEDVLLQIAHRAVRFFVSDFFQQIFRICVAESHRFPEVGAKFYASGPELMRSRMSGVLQHFVDRGELDIQDIALAAFQFGDLCKSDLFVARLCGMIQDCSEEDIARVATGAVETFIARYAKKPTQA